jgi:DNA-binding IscR family transcriptional regulator
MTNHRAAIINALAAGSHRSREIAEACGIDRKYVQVRLAELVQAGVVSSFRTLTGHQHGNEKFYRIRD